MALPEPRGQGRPALELWAADTFNVKTYILVLLTLVLTFYGQLIIKFRAVHHAETARGRRFLLLMFSDVWVISGLGAAMVASVAWMMAVRDAKLSFNYPTLASSFLLVPLLAMYMFGEAVTKTQILGWCLIVLYWKRAAEAPADGDGASSRVSRIANARHAINRIAADFASRGFAEKSFQDCDYARVCVLRRK